MAAGRLILPGFMPCEDRNGDRIPGALLYWYDNETTTLKAVYTTSDLSVSLPNPVPANDVGVWPAMWADVQEEYSVAGTEADGTPIPGLSYDGMLASLSAVNASGALAEAANISAQAAAVQAEEARDDAVAIADQFGDLDTAVTQAQTAATNAQTSETNAETAETNAVAAQAAAEAARDDAEAIVGFDPTKVVRVDSVQSFSAGEKLQGRQNIAAQPALGVQDREVVATPAIAAGVLTLDLAAASQFEVSWGANITSVVLQNVPAGTDATTWTLILVAAGGATFVPGGAFHPVGNVAAALSTTAGDRNFLPMTTRNAGTRVDYFYSGFTR